jgi:hypothetical protein
MDPINIATEWFGDIFEQEVIAALKEAVDESVEQIFADSQSTVKVQTGHLKSTGKTLPAKLGQKEVYGRIQYTAKYAIFQEFKSMWLRRAMIKNETRSLRNFEGKLGYGIRRKKK